MLRARRERRRRRGDPRLQPPGRRHRERQRPDRPLRAPAPGRADRRDVHIGNFVEVKKSIIGDGAKANHLAYLGDASGGRAREHRRRHHHLQLRRLRQALHRHRRRRLHRLEQRARRAGARSTTAPLSAPAASSPKRSKATRSRSTAAISAKPGWAAKFRAKKRAEKAAKSKIEGEDLICAASSASSASPTQRPSSWIALKRLEYRGYDSAGIATLVDGHHRRRRAPGKLINLDKACAKIPCPATSASATPAGPPTARRPRPTPTRTSTAGESRSSTTASSKTTASCANELQAEGPQVPDPRPTPRSSPTSSASYRQGRPSLQAVRDRRSSELRRRLSHSRSCIAASPTCSSPPGAAARSSSAYGDGETFVASDVAGHLAPHTREIVYLDENDSPMVTAAGADDPRPATRRCRARSADVRPRRRRRSAKGGYRHFMLKEIYEQPRRCANAARPARSTSARRLPGGPRPHAGPDRGSTASHHRLRHHATTRASSASTGSRSSRASRSRWSIASEFRYRDPIVGRRTARRRFIAQSGETADTLAALREAASKGQRAHGDVNVVGSSIARAGRRGAVHARRSGDRRRLDQGVHHPAHGAGDARALPRRGCGTLDATQRGRVSRPRRASRPCREAC